MEFTRQYFDTERLIHSIKTLIACLLGFAIVKFVHFQVSQWLIITIFVVMCAQINLGGVIQKASMRFLGTLTGSIIALSTILIFGHNEFVFSVVIGLSAVLFSYIATSDKSYSDSGTLGAVTVVVILINQHPTIQTGVERFFEIALGIIVATLVSQFLFPIRAQNHLRRNQADTLRQLRDFYQDILIKHSADSIKIEEKIIADESIIKSLIAQRKLATEAKRESFSKNFNVNNFKHSLWCEKEILRSIAFMSHAYRASDKCKKLIDQLPSIAQFHKDACIALEKIAMCFENKSSMVIIIPDIESIKQEIVALLGGLSEDEKIDMYGFLFCAELLRERLVKLVGLVKSIA